MRRSRTWLELRQEEKHSLLPKVSLNEGDVQQEKDLQVIERDEPSSEPTNEALDEPTEGNAHEREMVPRSNGETDKKT
jgi:hypothetical protein